MKKYFKSTKTIQPFGVRMKSHIISYIIDLQEIATVDIPKSPPWLLLKPKFVFDLRKYKKSEANQLLIQQQFAEIRLKIRLQNDLH